MASKQIAELQDYSVQLEKIDKILREISTAEGDIGVKATSSRNKLAEIQTTLQKGGVVTAAEFRNISNSMDDFQASLIKIGNTVQSNFDDDGVKKLTESTETLKLEISTLQKEYEKLQSSMVLKSNSEDFKKETLHSAARTAQLKEEYNSIEALSSARKRAKPGSLEKEQLKTAEEEYNRILKEQIKLEGNTQKALDDKSLVIKSAQDTLIKQNKLLDKTIEKQRILKELEIKANDAKIQSGTVVEDVRTTALTAERTGGKVDIGSIIGANKTMLAMNNTVTKAASTFIKFNIILRSMKKIASEAINTVKQMDAAFTGMTVVTGKSREEVKGYLGDFQRIAKATSTSMTDIANLTTRYVQQGRNMVDALILTEKTAEAARIANISTADSIQYMTSAVNGFNLAATQAGRVSDIFAILASKSATDYESLAIALSKVSAQANTAGMSIEYTTALLAKGIETTQEAPESIGTALKTVLARMRELSDYGATLEDGIGVNRVEKALDAAGINLRDLNGQFREMDQIFNEMGSKWDTLDKNVQQAVSQAIAGSRQQSRFLAIMQDWERTQELVTVANNAAGTSAYQASQEMKGLDANLTNLQTSWQAFTQSLVPEEALISGIKFVSGAIEGITKYLEAGGWLTKSLFTTVLAVSATMVLISQIQKAIYNSRLKTLQLQQEQGVSNIRELVSSKALVKNEYEKLKLAIASANANNTIELKQMRLLGLKQAEINSLVQIKIIKGEITQSDLVSLGLADRSLEAINRQLIGVNSIKLSELDMISLSVTQLMWRTLIGDQEAANLLFIKISQLQEKKGLAGLMARLIFKKQITKETAKEATTNAANVVAEKAQTAEEIKQLTLKKASNRVAKIGLALSAISPFAWIMLAVAAVAAITVGVIAIANAAQDITAETDKIKENLAEVHENTTKVSDLKALLKEYKEIEATTSKTLEQQDRLSEIQDEINEALGTTLTKQNLVKNTEEEILEIKKKSNQLQQKSLELALQATRKNKDAATKDANVQGVFQKSASKQAETVLGEDNDITQYVDTPIVRAEINKLDITSDKTRYSSYLTGTGANTSSSYGALANAEQQNRITASNSDTARYKQAINASTSVEELESAVSNDVIWKSVQIYKKQLMETNTALTDLEATKFAVSTNILNNETQAAIELNLAYQKRAKDMDIYSKAIKSAEKKSVAERLKVMKTEYAKFDKNSQTFFQANNPFDTMLLLLDNDTSTSDIALGFMTLAENMQLSKKASEELADTMGKMTEAEKRRFLSTLGTNRVSMLTTYGQTNEELSTLAPEDIQNDEKAMNEWLYQFKNFRDSTLGLLDIATINSLVISNKNAMGTLIDFREKLNSGKNITAEEFMEFGSQNMDLMTPELLKAFERGGPADFSIALKELESTIADKLSKNTEVAQKKYEQSLKEFEALIPKDSNLKIDITTDIEKIIAQLKILGMSDEEIAKLQIEQEQAFNDSTTLNFAKIIEKLANTAKQMSKFEHQTDVFNAQIGQLNKQLKNANAREQIAINTELTALSQARNEQLEAEKRRIENDNSSLSKDYTIIGDQVIPVLEAYNNMTAGEQASFESMQTSLEAILKEQSSLTDSMKGYQEAIKAAKAEIVGYQEQMANLVKAQYQKEYEDLKESLEKRKALYDKYFDSLEYKEDEKTYDEERQRLMSSIAKLSTATDSVSIAKRKEQMQALAALEKEQLQNQRESQKDAVAESIEDQQEVAEEDYNKAIENMEALYKEMYNKFKDIFDTKGIVASKEEFIKYFSEWDSAFKNTTEEGQDALKIKYGEIFDVFFKENAKAIVTEEKQYVPGTVKKEKVNLSFLNKDGSVTVISVDADKAKAIVDNGNGIKYETNKDYMVATGDKKFDNDINKKADDDYLKGKDSLINSGNSKVNPDGSVTFTPPAGGSSKPPSTQPPTSPPLAPTPPTNGNWFDTAVDWIQDAWNGLFGKKTYADGGYVDYTGIAKVDGTKSKPEAFLNAKQTALLSNFGMQLEKSVNTSIQSTPFNGGISNDSSISIDKIEINIKGNDLGDKQNQVQIGNDIVTEFSTALKRRGISINVKR